jgi:hypothetical protein
MPKKKKAKSATAKYREERRQLVELLVARFPTISTERADAIVRRYGPSEGRCIAAAETLQRIKALGLGSSNENSN